MINLIVAFVKSSVELLLKIFQRKHLSSEPEFEAVTTYMKVFIIGCPTLVKSFIARAKLVQNL